MPLPIHNRPVFRDMAAPDLVETCRDWLASHGEAHARAGRVRILLALAQAAEPGARVSVCPADWELLRCPA